MNTRAGFLVVCSLLLTGGAIGETPRTTKQTLRYQPEKRIQIHMEVPTVNRYLQMSTTLNLSQRQIALLNNINNEYSRKAGTLMATTRQKMLELSALLGMTAPHFVTARGKAKEYADNQLAIKIALVDATEKACDVLTPKQRDILSRQRTPSPMKRLTVNPTK